MCITHWFSMKKFDCGLCSVRSFAQLCDGPCRCRTKSAPKECLSFTGLGFVLRTKPPIDVDQRNAVLSRVARIAALIGWTGQGQIQSLRPEVTLARSYETSDRLRIQNNIRYELGSILFFFFWSNFAVQIALKYLSWCGGSLMVGRDAIKVGFALRRSCRNAMRRAQVH